MIRSYIAGLEAERRETVELVRRGMRAALELAVRAEAAIVVGAALFVAGVALVYVPAALMLAGVVVAALGIGQLRAGATPRSPS